MHASKGSGQITKTFIKGSSRVLSAHPGKGIHGPGRGPAGRGGRRARAGSGEWAAHPPPGWEIPTCRLWRRPPAARRRSAACLPARGPEGSALEEDMQSQVNLRGWSVCSDRGGGGGGTASLKVTTHCQTTAPVFSGLSVPEFSLTAPYF